MAADQDNSNGKVTLALIGQQLTYVSKKVDEIAAKSDSMTTFCAHQEELNKTVDAQLWDKNKNSRMQAVEQGVVEAKCEAQTAISWTRFAIYPISLAVIVGLVTLGFRIFTGQ